MSVAFIGKLGRRAGGPFFEAFDDDNVVWRGRGKAIVERRRARRVEQSRAEQSRAVELAYRCRVDPFSTYHAHHANS